MDILYAVLEKYHQQQFRNILNHKDKVIRSSHPSRGVGFRVLDKFMKSDPFYRLTAYVEDADEEETAEILDVINNLDDDDLTITSRKSFSA